MIEIDQPASRFDTFRPVLMSLVEARVPEPKPALIQDIQLRIMNICRHIDITVFENVVVKSDDTLKLDGWCWYQCFASLRQT